MWDYLCFHEGIYDYDNISILCVYHLLLILFILWLFFSLFLVCGWNIFTWWWRRKQDFMSIKHSYFDNEQRKANFILFFFFIQLHHIIVINEGFFFVSFNFRYIYMLCIEKKMKCLLRMRKKKFYNSRENSACETHPKYDDEILFMFSRWMFLICWE